MTAGKTYQYSIYFTFHNVSINTLQQKQKALADEIFTFHNVSINTDSRRTAIHAFFELYIPQCFY